MSSFTTTAMVKEWAVAPLETRMSGLVRDFAGLLVLMNDVCSDCNPTCSGCRVTAVLIGPKKKKVCFRQPDPPSKTGPGLALFFKF